MSKPDKPIEKPKGKPDEARGRDLKLHNNSADGARHGGTTGAQHG